jgi:hypothetical protein
MKSSTNRNLLNEEGLTENETVSICRKIIRQYDLQTEDLKS